MALNLRFWFGKRRFSFANIHALVLLKSRYEDKFIVISIPHDESSIAKRGQHLLEVNCIVWKDGDTEPPWLPLETPFAIGGAPQAGECDADWKLCSRLKIKKTFVCEELGLNGSDPHFAPSPNPETLTASNSVGWPSIKSPHSSSNRPYPATIADRSVFSSSVKS